MVETHGACGSGLTSPPWTGYRSALMAAGGAALSGGVVYSLMAALLGSPPATFISALALSLTVGAALAYLGWAPADLEPPGLLVVRRRLLPPGRYDLSELVEFVDVTSVEWYLALRRIPGLLAAVLSTLAAAAAAFAWGYLRSLPPAAAVPAAALSALCFSSVEFSTLISPGLGLRRGQSDRLIGAACLLLLLGGIAVLAWSLWGGTTLEKMTAAGPMAGIGVAGTLKGLLGVSRPGYRSVFRLGFQDGRLVYVMALTEKDAANLREALMEAVAHAKAA